MLGVNRLHLNSLRRRRDSSARMYGRATGAAGQEQQYQLPLDEIPEASRGPLKAELEEVGVVQDT